MRHLELLVAPHWWSLLAWSGLARLDRYLDGMAGGLAPTAARAQEAVRASARCEILLDRWEGAVGGYDPRLPAALGLARRSLRELAVVREECLLAAGGAAAGGFSEARLQSGLDALAKSLAAGEAGRARARARLGELGQRLAGAADGPAARRLGGECTRLLAMVDDLGLGCDLAGSAAMVAAFSDRALLLLARA